MCDLQSHPFFRWNAIVSFLGLRYLLFGQGAKHFVAITLYLHVISYHLRLIVAVVLNGKDLTRKAFLDKASKRFCKTGVHYVTAFAIRQGIDIEVFHKPKFAHTIGKVSLRISPDIDTQRGFNDFLKCFNTIDGRKDSSVWMFITSYPLDRITESRHQLSRQTGNDIFAKHAVDVVKNYWLTIMKMNEQTFLRKFLAYTRCIFDGLLLKDAKPAVGECLIVEAFRGEGIALPTLAVLGSTIVLVVARKGILDGTAKSIVAVLAFF